MNPSISEFPVAIPIVVAWGDMDSLGHVNNTMFFRYFESVRMAYFFKIEEPAASKGSKIGPILAAANCKFISSLVYPDTITAVAKVTKVMDDRIIMEHRLFGQMGAKLAAIGEATIVSFDYAKKTKVPFPKIWIDRIEALEGRLP